MNNFQHSIQIYISEKNYKYAEIINGFYFKLIVKNCQKFTRIPATYLLKLIYFNDFFVS